jgi:uroporphyrinogen-III synthase
MRVIVTRPAQDGSAWVKAFSEHGHEVLALPLIEISAAPDRAPLRQAWQQLSRYHAVMFVSGNAVTQFFAAQDTDAKDTLASWAQQATQTRAWGTGPGTRQALLRAGVAALQIDAPTSGQFDSEALWQLVCSGVRPGQRVLIVRGSDAAQVLDASASGVGRDWLASTLRGAGVEVDFVVAYARQVPRWSAQQLALADSAAQDGSLWLFSSAEALANLRQLMPQQNWQAARALTTHPRIAQAAREAGFGVVQESRPSLQEIVASIESQA